MTNATMNAIRCHIVLTNTAREAIKQHFQDEHALFNLEKAFTVYIEKESIDNNQIQLGLYFDPQENTKLAAKFPERVVIMDCLFDLKSGLVAKSFRTRGKGTPVATNRREKMRIHFVPTRINGHKYADNFIQVLAELPVSKDRFDYVNKRISSWEGYLKVLDKNAAIDDIQAKFSKPSLSSDCSRLTITLQNIEKNQWKQLKGLSTRIRGMHQEIGEVIKVTRGERLVEIELKPDIASKARKGDLDLTVQDVEFSNASTKSQLRRLLKGFERLKEGLAANANLETILFEDKPTIAKRKTLEPLEFNNTLNEFQQAAVTGAMEAEDLYVIQGPPGTGKTTVISEICYQNAKAGLKTLVASQSNLAVDNALSRLLSNKDIRILRYGRTEAIEEEGKKFIEENVALYWKNQTYEAICAEIANHSVKEQQLQDTLQDLNQETSDLEAKIKMLDLEIVLKKEAEQQLPSVKKQISELKKQLVQLKAQQEAAEATYASLIQNKESIDKKIHTAKAALGDEQHYASQKQKLEHLKEEYTQVTKELEAAELQQQIIALQKQVASQQALLTRETSIDSTHNDALVKVASLTKVAEIEQFMIDYAIRRSFAMDRLLARLDQLQESYEQYKSLNAIKVRIHEKITYCATVIGITVDHVALPGNHNYSIPEVDTFLQKLDKVIESKKLNKDNGLRTVEGLHMRNIYIEQQFVAFTKMIEETKIIFTKLKQEIAKQFKEQAGASAASSQKHRDELQRLQGRLTVSELHLSDLNMPTAREIELIQADRLRLDREQRFLQEQLGKLAQYSEEIIQGQQQLAPLITQILEADTALQTIKDAQKLVNSDGIQLEKTYTELDQRLKSNPEDARQACVLRQKKIAELQATIETQIVLLPMTADIQLQWKTMLEQASDYDLDEIRKLYVKHSNVIGTTCVASANKQFMDNYPTFDVVIIDEVSKATPPELLLPMLKGSKIILVGDHHQLPPLIGDETFEETLEQVIKDSNTFEQKRELEKLLEESLFERLYKIVPNTNKTMLAIQYRMHENIMKTIAPFYKNANEELQCGLPDSDAARDHLLETSLFDRSNHLLWIDVPNEAPYFEERMQGGSSLFNDAELKQIRNMLIKLNEATANAKSQGLMDDGSLKSIGVISFYAEQVKRINRMIEQELQLPHLHIRTGSVDKFQGMEMDVIIVSMVRNNNGQGDIGFAKDYRRLNVALSRARELLICLGSTEMFTKKAKKQETRDMYAHVVEEVKKQAGYRNLEAIEA